MQHQGRDAQRLSELKTPKRRLSSRFFGVFNALDFASVKQLKVLISTLLFRKAILVVALLIVPCGVLFSAFNGVGQKAYAVTAGTSKTLNFQARLLTNTGALVPDGLYNIEFKIYDVSSSGTALWTETRKDTNGATAGNDFRVSVSNGYFSVNLGDADPTVGGTAFSGIDWSQQLWLTMNIGGTTQTASPTWDGEMSPRIALTGVPLAFVANNVNSGNTNAASTNSGNVSVQSGNTTGSTSNSGTVILQSGNVTNGNSGNVTIDAGSASGTKGTLSLGATNASSITLGHNGGTTTVYGDLNVSGSGTALQVYSGAQFFSSAVFASGLTVTTGQNLVVNGDTFTDLTGAGLTVSSGALTIDTTSTTGFFKNGGNAFTANSVLGNTGNYSLSFITNNTTALTISNAQNATFSGTLSVPGSGTASERFGANAVGSGNYSTAVGNGATASVTNAIALGFGSNAGGGSGSIAIGVNSASNGGQSVSIGETATTASAAIAVGGGSSAVNYGVAIGAGAVVSGQKGIALGTGATAGANQLVIGANNMEIQNAYIGNGVTNSAPLGIILQATGGSGSNIAGASFTLAGGRGTGTGAGGNIVFQYAPAGSSGSSLNALQTACTISGTNGSFSCPGSGASSERFGAGATATGIQALAVGNSASANYDSSIAIGVSSSVSGTQSAAVGRGATAAGDAVALGYNAAAVASGVALGSASNAAYSNSIALGRQAVTTASNQLVVGSVNLGITDIYFGNGVTAATPSAFTLQATGGSGTNVAGAATMIAGGKGTGTGVGGNIVFQYAPAGSTGSTLNALQTACQISGTDGSLSCPGTGSNSERFGTGATSSNTNSVAVGRLSVASGAQSAAFGGLSSASGTNAAALGGNASAGANYATAVGSDTVASNTGSIAIGYNTVSSGASSIALGTSASITAGNSVVIGSSASSNCSNCTLVGYGTSASGSSGSTAIGYQAFANGTSLAVGTGTHADNGSVALGSGATTGGNFLGVSVGNGATVSGNEGIAIGQGTTAAYQGIALGTGATAGANQFVVTGATSGYFGNGATNASPAGFILQGTGGSGSNVAGASFTLAGGKGTGTGVGGDLNFQTAKAGSSGSSLNSLQSVLTLSGTNGGATFQNSVNSATGLVVKNSAGTSALIVDTTPNDSNLLADPSFEATSGSTGWADYSANALSRTSGQKYIGAQSLAITTAAGVDGARTYNVTLAPSTTYTFSGYLKAASGSFSTMEMGHNPNNFTDTSCLTGQTVTTTWKRFSCTFTTGGSIGSAYVYFKQTDSTSRTFYIDGVRLETGSTLNNYAEANFSLNGTIVSPVSINTTQAGQTGLTVKTGNAASVGQIIQGSASQSADLLQFRDSNNSYIGGFDSAGTYCVSTSLSICGGTYALYAATGITLVQSSGNAALSISQTSTQAILAGAGGVRITGPSSAALLGENSLIVRGSSGQTGKIFEVQNSSNTPVASISTTGAALFQNSTNSTSAFQIQNATGVNLLNADTTNAIVSVNGGLDVSGDINSPFGGFGATGNLLQRSEQLDNGSWSRSNITSVTQDAVTAPDGQVSAETITSSGSGTHSLTQSKSTTTNGNYTFSIWLKSSTNQPVQLRIDSTGATPGTGTATSYTLNSTWTRYSVTQNFTGTPSAITATLLITNNSQSIDAWGAQMIRGTSRGVYTSNVNGGNGNLNNGAVVSGDLAVTSYIKLGGSINDCNNMTCISPGQIETGTSLTLLAHNGGSIWFTAGSGNFIFDNSGSNVLTTVSNKDLNIAPNGTGNLTVGTSDTTGTLLVLDTKTGSGDPTGVNGAMYYNSNAGKFRCYQNGAWTDCIGAGGGGGSLFTDAGTQTYLTSTSDELVVGGSSSLSAKLSVVGTSDQEQLLVRAYSSQTNANPLIVAQTSAGAELFRLNAKEDTSIFLGSESGLSITSGTYNTGIGSATLRNTSTGILNTALGHAALYANTGSSNTALGAFAMFQNTSGGGNVAVGQAALYSNSTGASNVAIGYEAQKTATGSNNIGIGEQSLYATTGSNNTATGVNTLQANTSGSYNTANGRQALISNTTGSYNTGIGSNSINTNTTGSSNSALGTDSLYNLQSGDGNSVIGYQAGLGITTGSNNTFIGKDAGKGDGVFNQTNVSGSSAFGAHSVILQSDSIAIGGSDDTGLKVGIGNAAPQNFFSAGAYTGFTGTASQSGTTVTATSSVFAATLKGYQIVFADGTSRTITAYTSGTVVTVAQSGTVSSQVFRVYNPGLQVTSSGNVGIGVVNPSGATLSIASNTNQPQLKITAPLSQDSSNPIIYVENSSTELFRLTAPDAYSIFLGRQAGTVDNGNGNQNTGIGTQALGANTNGYYNTAIGSNALGSNISGVSNSALGVGALAGNTTGIQNVAIGVNALNSNNANYNTAVGTVALQNNTSGTNNVALGAAALLANTTGTDNTALGFEALRNNGSASGSIAIGSGTMGNAVGGSANIAVGNASQSNASGSFNVSIGSQALGVASDNENTAIGHRALQGASSASGNTALGNVSLNGVTTGDNNIGIGNYAGDNITTGSNNIIIGANIDAASATADNQLNIGNVLQGDTSVGSALFKNVSDSTTAFQIQNAAGVSLFTVDTSNTKISINANVEAYGTINSPFGGFGLQTTNLINGPENLNSWTTKTNITSVTNGATSPAGDTMADTIVTGAGSPRVISQNTNTATAIGTYTFSIYMKTNSGTQPFSMSIEASGSVSPTTSGNTVANYTATTTWKRYTVTQTFTGTSATNYIPKLTFTNGTATLVAWGAMMNSGSAPGVYAPRTEFASAYSDVGASVRGGLQITDFNGKTAQISVYSGGYPGVGNGHFRFTAGATNGVIAEFRDCCNSIFTVGNTGTASVFGQGLTVYNGLTTISGVLTGSNSETFSVGTTDGQFTLGRNDAGTVTLTAADNDANADLVVAAGGTGTTTLGSTSNAAAEIRNGTTENVYIKNSSNQNRFIFGAGTLSQEFNNTNSGTLHLIQSSGNTQNGAYIGTNIDLSTNITVPNSSSGNQTGLQLTVKDGGASATAVGVSLQGTGDTAFNIGGTFTNLFTSTNFNLTNLGAATFGSSTQAGSLVLSDGSSNTVTLTASGVGTNYSLTLPTTAGTTTQCLQTDSVVASQLIFGTCNSGSGDGGATSLGSVDGQAANNNGGSIVGTIFYQQSATTSFPGLVNIAAQSFAGVKSFTNGVIIGSATADGTQVNLQLDSYSTFADNGTCNTTTNQGAMYYNTASEEIRACIASSWHDVASTEDLALLLFGVVPNSGPTPGDLVGVNGNANSPCKVYFASTTTYSIASCSAYSGGRKVKVASVTGAAIGTITSGNFVNICLNSSGVPTLMGGASATDGAQTAGNLTTTNGITLGQPLLCLATIRGGASNTISNIYDIRTFTTTTKAYATLNSATQILGGVYQASTTFGLISATAAAAATNIQGILVAGTNAASTTTANVILAIDGPQWVKATGTAAFPATATTNTPLAPSTTAGYATTATTLATYGNSIGTPLAPAIATSCSTNTTAALTNCQTSQFTNLHIR